MKPIYGIDLGTTYTKCALVRPTDNVIQGFKLDRDRLDSPQNTLAILRSAVTVGMIEEKKVAYVGMRSLVELEDFAEGDPPQRRFEETKIWIGEGADGNDPDAPPWPFPEHDWSYRPEDIGALVLRKVKKEVEAAAGPALERVVVTHPEYFTDTRRKATRDAVAVAGLELVDTLTEPNAAALAYGVETRHGGRFMIFDIGGGTLDVTVCRIEAHQMVALGTDGAKIGGRDFDRLIFDRMCDEYATTYPSFDVAFIDENTKQIWMRSAESAKRLLNEQNVASLKYACRTASFEGQDKRLRLQHAEFLTAAKPLIDASVQVAESALERAKLRWSDLDSVICVGGTSRLKPLRSALEAALGKALPQSEIDADTAIARGAAIHGNRLATKCASIVSIPSAVSPPEQRTTLEIIGVLPRALGIRAYDSRQRRDVISPILPKGTRLPTTSDRGFKTLRDNQSVIEVELYEDEGPNPDDCHRIGRVELTGFPPGPAGQRVEVKINIESNGVKHIIVSALGRQNEAVIEFDPDRVLGGGEIERRRAFVASLTIL